MRRKQRTHNHQARPGNKNARKAPPWITYTLDTRENLDRFIGDIIKATWTGKLGTRQASTINAATKLLLEFRGWIQKIEGNNAPGLYFNGKRITSAEELDDVVRRADIHYAKSWQQEKKEMIRKAIDTMTEEEQHALAKAIAKVDEVESAFPQDG